MIHFFRIFSMAREHAYGRSNRARPCAPPPSRAARVVAPANLSHIMCIIASSVICFPFSLYFCSLFSNSLVGMHVGWCESGLGGALTSSSCLFPPALSFLRICCCPAMGPRRRLSIISMYSSFVLIASSRVRRGSSCCCSLSSQFVGGGMRFCP